MLRISSFWAVRRTSSSPLSPSVAYFLPACAGEIFADILKTQNCAICCDGEPEAPCNEEDLLRELEQMLNKSDPN